MIIIDKIIKGLMLSETDNDNKQVISYIKKWVEDNNVNDVEIIILRSLWDDILVDNYYNVLFNEDEFKSIVTIVSDKKFEKISKKYRSIIKPVIFDNYKSIDILSVGPDVLAYGPLDLNDEINDEYPYWLILKIK